MKMFWNNKKAKPPVKQRGPYRTASDRAKELNAKADAIISKAFVEYLRTHPKEAEEIARQKFGLKLSKDDDDEHSSYDPPDVLRTLRDASEIKNYLKDEIGAPSEEGGIMGLIKSVIASDREGKLAGAIGEFVSGLSSAMRGQRPPQNEVQPTAPQLPQQLVQSLPSPQIPRQNSVQPASGVTDLKQGISLSTLVPLLVEVPQDVVDTLGDYSPKWVRFLAKSSYEDLLKLARRITVPENLKPQLEELTSPPRKDWVLGVIEAAKTWVEDNPE